MKEESAKTTSSLLPERAKRKRKREKGYRCRAERSFQERERHAEGLHI